jgi:biopolymer transport protein ExbD
MTRPNYPKKTARTAAIPLPVRPLKLWQDRESDRSEARIEVVPMIDIIFCILIFFILSAVGISRQQVVSLDLPKASTGTTEMREMLVVSLDELGQVYVEQQPVTRNQLTQALQNYLQFNPNGQIVLNANRNANYNEVVQVLDLLRKIGGSRAALAILPGESQSQSDPLNSFPNGIDNSSGTGNNPGSNLPGESTLPQTPSNPNSGLGNNPSDRSNLNNSNSPLLPNNVPSAPNNTPGNTQPDGSSNR